VIEFETFTLDNGLRVIHHYDSLKSSAVLNILYNVGARDESIDKTGFAHLFEHLMFGGSANIPEYDGPLQEAGGQNNAFTSNDLTNYYIQVPVENIETAFWLESDRMKHLNFSQKSLDVQKGVVIEEFKQRYLNQPYGQAFMHIRSTAYQTHPYQWPTIGKEIFHIEDAKLQDVMDFFKRFYLPNNAIACVAGNISLEKTKALFEKWFADIDAGTANKNQYPQENKQLEPRRFVAPQANAQMALYLAFHTCSKKDKAHYALDLMSDMLSNGKNSLFYKKLVEEENIFTSIDAYVGEELDPSLFYISGRIAENITVEKAESSLWNVIETFKNKIPDNADLERRKNKLITARKYHETDLLNKAMALCIAENMGNIDLVNTEAEHYNLVSVTDIKEQANKTLTKNNCTTIIYDKITK